MLSELLHVERLALSRHPLLKVSPLCNISHKGADYPIHGFSLGSQDPEAPVFGLFGGVHGLEKIGTHVVTTFLDCLIQRLPWDSVLHWQLERMRIIVIPLINPVGMALHRRGNANSVDLMRNSPILAQKATPLVGGQSFSPWLPWFRGNPLLPEAETQAVTRFVKRESFSSKVSILMDVHSGFGVMDRIWFPFAHSQTPFPHLPELLGLTELFDEGYPHHIYRFEPQSKNYTTHGDLWDFIYQQYQLEGPKDGLCLPLTLEMGSWAWVKKNPLQLFSFLGPFNPIKPHRHRRVLRRHQSLLDFLSRAALAHESWARPDQPTALKRDLQAKKLWYSNGE